MMKETYTKEEMLDLMYNFYCEILGGFIAPSNFPDRTKLKKNIDSFLAYGFIKY